MFISIHFWGIKEIYNNNTLTSTSEGSADLWASKVLVDNGSGYSEDIPATIRHAVDQAIATG